MKVTAEKEQEKYSGLKRRKFERLSRKNFCCDKIG